MTPSTAPPSAGSAASSYEPFFSVLLVNWNSNRFLISSLDALNRQVFTDFEVLLLDNGSDEALPNDLPERYPSLGLKVFRSEENLGFAGGNNFLARESKGTYLALLNVDAFAEPRWLEVLHTAALEHPQTFFASRLISASDENILDGEWNVLHCSGLAWRHHHSRPIHRTTNQERHVFSACAAAAAYPRQGFQEVNGFDDVFFAYMEDVDLDFRLQLVGYSCVYLPDAVAFHVGAGSTHSRSGFMLRHGHRNLIWTFIKNMPGWLFWVMLPCHIFVNLFYILLSFFIKDGDELRHGKSEALTGLKKIWQKRLSVQHLRKVSVWSIAKQLDWNPLSPLIKITYK